MTPSLRLGVTLGALGLDWGLMLEVLATVQAHGLVPAARALPPVELSPASLLLIVAASVVLGGLLEALRVRRHQQRLDDLEAQLGEDAWTLHRLSAQLILYGPRLSELDQAALLAVHDQAAAVVGLPTMAGTSTAEAA